MNTKSFRFEREGPVVTLRLDRPEALNALTFDVYRELTDTLVALKDDQGLGAVVLTGTGRAFCTGGDVREIIGPLLEKDEAELLAFTTLTCDLIQAICGLPRPVVASLNGTAAGAGAVIALASDVRIAADSAKIAFLFVKVGLSGADMGAAHLLPRVVGLGRAAELLMTGDFVDAAEAYRIGLYNQVVPAADLARATAEMAHRLARGPRAGLAATKAALLREMDMDLHTALGHEARVQAELMRGADFREGFRAFQERRRPRFEGTPE